MIVQKEVYQNFTNMNIMVIQPDVRYMIIAHIRAIPLMSAVVELIMNKYCIMCSTGKCILFNRCAAVKIMQVDYQRTWIDCIGRIGYIIFPDQPIMGEGKLCFTKGD